MTIYQLLTHTSGIGDDADEEAGEDYEAIWQSKPNPVYCPNSNFMKSNFTFKKQLENTPINHVKANF